MQDRGTARENLDVNEDLDPTEAVLYTNPQQNTFCLFPNEDPSRGAKER